MRFYSKLSHEELLTQLNVIPSWVIFDYVYQENDKILYMYHIDTWSEDWIDLLHENNWIDNGIDESQLLDLLYEMGFENDIEIIWS